MAEWSGGSLLLDGIEIVPPGWLLEPRAGASWYFLPEAAYTRQEDRVVDGDLSAAFVQKSTGNRFTFALRSVRLTAVDRDGAALALS